MEGRLVEDICKLIELPDYYSFSPYFFNIDSNYLIARY